MNIDFTTIPKDNLLRMSAAGFEINECYRVLGKVDSNVVGDILRNESTFYEWDHYPSGDVYDRESHAQYYYHAHRPEGGEHGHFHTFMRFKGIPKDIEAYNYQGDADWPQGDDRLSHIVAITMDKMGKPTDIFTTNRWVTGENWYKAEDVIEMNKLFEIDHSWPSWPANRWISAFMCLFHPQIEKLLIERDQKMAAWQKTYPDRDIYEDRELEITSKQKIDVEKQMRKVNEALSKLA